MKKIGNRMILAGIAVWALLVFSGHAKAQPASGLKDYPLDTINGEVVYKYQVERSIGLYRIGVNFNVSQSDIVRLNPQLRERGLHYGETLLIPTGTFAEQEESPRAIEETNPAAEPKTETAAVAAPEPAVAKSDSIKADTSSVLTAATDTVVTADSTDRRRIMELALMLPFESRQTKRSGNAERMLDFYQGVLLALHDLQNDSVRYRLRVYDTERSERRVTALCDSTELDSVKGILGLAYPIQIERMAEWCELHKVPLLLPFSDNIDLNGRSQLYQFNSPDKDKASALAQWAKGQTDMHYVAVEVRESELAESIRTLREQMQAEGLSLNAVGLHEIMTDSAAYAFSPDKVNLVVLHSDRYHHIRMMLPHLVRLKEAGYRIRIVSQYSWQKENIELPQVYTTVFNTESSREEYESLRDHYFSEKPVSDQPRYDLLGYDLMHALIGCIEGKNEYTGKLTNITWQKTNDNSGYQNINIQVEIKE
ncbi:MAG: hypothetical protein IJ204_00105 [Paludibacteraceae bacterium]|nr:hypothetical protein [Paludibacteraceae bacterium]